MNATNNASVIAVSQALFDKACARSGLLGAFLVGSNSTYEEFECLLAYNIPIEPFQGKEKQFLTDVLLDCRKHLKPHLHNVGAFALPNLAKRVGNWPEGTKRAWFEPLKIGEKAIVFLGFVSHQSNSMAYETQESTIRLIGDLLNTARELKAAELRLSATETFVRQVGHDFAGSITAIVSKLHTLRSLSGMALSRKIDEIEVEIEGANAMAEHLGIATDSHYGRRNLTYFCLCEVAEGVIRKLESEAKERKIRFEIHRNFQGTAPACGDKNAVEIAIFQIMHNAVKYSFGSTFVECTVYCDSEFSYLIVTNKGHPLPGEDEKPRIWDLGFRGSKAKELHVNGSGIGLYTVKKIVSAHLGACSIEQRENKTTFKVSFPKRDINRNKSGIIHIH